MRKYSYAQEVCIRSAGKVMQQTAMLWPGCRIGVALSGGVDSCVLLKVLTIRQRIVPFRFEIMALHLNPGFDPDNHTQLVPWLTSLGVPFHFASTRIGLEAHEQAREGHAACFRCAWLRRRRLFELCARYHLTHLAFGHNAGDLLGTFFLNLTHNGRVDGMGIHEHFFNGKLRVIRPLLLVEKKYIKSASKRWSLPVFPNPCPSAGHSSRASVEELIASFDGIHKGAMRTMSNALTRWQLETDCAKIRSSAAQD